LLSWAFDLSGSPSGEPAEKHLPSRLPSRPSPSQDLTTSDDGGLRVSSSPGSASPSEEGAGPSGLPHRLRPQPLRKVNPPRTIFSSPGPASPHEEPAAGLCGRSPPAYREVAHRFGAPLSDRMQPRPRTASGYCYSGRLLFSRQVGIPATQGFPVLHFIALPSCCPFSRQVGIPGRSVIQA
jgi:hypothetical protein